MFGRKLLGALVALSLLTGCFGGKGDSESSSVLSKVETVFGEVTIPRPKGHDLRVVALGWSDAEAALAVGIKPVAVYDWISFGNKGVGPWAEGLFGDVKPTVMSFSTDGLNWEQIKAFKPDVILDVRSKNDEKTYKRLSQIAPTVYGPKNSKDYQPYQIPWRDQQRQVAKALGRVKEGEEAIKKTEKAIKDAQDPLYRGLKGAFVAKFAEYGVYLPGDGRWDLMQELGFTLEPKINELPKAGFYAKIPTDKLSWVDTDVLIVISIGTDDITKDALLSSLKAAKEGRVIYANKDLANVLSASSALSIREAIKRISDKLREIAKKLRNK